ncbi:MAG TPA: 50S ribosomal protein L25/general stress protein Ctc [Burkholderiaceae bacterium]|nr:50S ribosomal protein L25/general stress protein Ctc [Burkholderiaceae bacterium]
MKVVARTRQEQGTGASRRLRRAGFVPGIVYGSKSEPTPVSIEHNPLFHALRVEAFHSSILDLELDGKSEQVLLRNVQWHPFKQQVLHVDLQRVAGDEKLTVKVPLHFVNQEVSPAVKLSSAIIGHVLNEIEVSCLPKDLPSFIEVDLSTLEATQTIHADDLKLPAGVTLVGSAVDNPVLVTVTLPVADTDEDAESEEAK